MVLVVLWSCYTGHFPSGWSFSRTQRWQVKQWFFKACLHSNLRTAETCWAPSPKIKEINTSESGSDCVSEKFFNVQNNQRGACVPFMCWDFNLWFMCVFPQREWDWLRASAEYVEFALFLCSYMTLSHVLFLLVFGKVQNHRSRARNKNQTLGSLHSCS